MVTPTRNRAAPSRHRRHSHTTFPTVNEWCATTVLELICGILALMATIHVFLAENHAIYKLNLEILAQEQPYVLSKKISSGGSSFAPAQSMAPLPPHTNLSISVLVHPGNREAHTWIENMKYGYTHGREVAEITDFVVLYDGRNSGEKLDELLRNMKQLQQEGTVQKVVELKFDKSYADAFGMQDPKHKDQAMYATYQFIVEECRTTHCAFLTDDVLAHEGGGLGHAVRLLEEHPLALVATPPLARYFADFANDTLRHDFHHANGSWTYPKSVGKIHIPALDGSLVEPSCQSHHHPDFSTRHLVVDRNRFMASLPWPTSTRPFLEQHPHVQQSRERLVSPECKHSAAFLVHPPPWHMGKRLMTHCGIRTLQKAVEHPEGLVIDKNNNMLEESWAEACTKCKSKQRS